MKPIATRPHHVFKSLVTETLSDRICRAIIPHPANFSGGVLTLESMLIVTLMKRSEPLNVFEFGTYMGATTALLAINARDDGKIYTIDLPQSGDAASLTASDQESIISATRSSEETPDGFLIKRSTSIGPVILDGMDAAVRAKVTKLYGDSTKFDYAAYAGSMDFIWIDGGHDYEIVRSDTENALKMLNRNNKMATIAWHDYENPECPGVTRYLNELSETLTIFSIGSTLTCFCCPHIRDGGIEI